MKNKFTLLAMITSLVVGSQASALVINDRNAFEASLDTIIQDDYENAAYTFSQSDVQMSAVLGETQYTATGFSNNNLVFSRNSEHFYCAGCNGSFQLDFANTSVGNSDGVYGVGFDFFNAYLPEYYGFVTYGDGSVENILFDQVALPETQFFGIISDLQISSIHFGLFDGGTTRAGSFGIDNLTIGNAAQVPEPGSLVLLSLGLAGIGISRKKKPV